MTMLLYLCLYLNYTTWYLWGNRQSQWWHSWTQLLQEIVSTLLQPLPPANHPHYIFDKKWPFKSARVSNSSKPGHNVSQETENLPQDRRCIQSTRAKNKKTENIGIHFISKSSASDNKYLNHTSLPNSPLKAPRRISSLQKWNWLIEGSGWRKREWDEEKKTNIIPVKAAVDRKHCPKDNWYANKGKYQIVWW